MINILESIPVIQYKEGISPEDPIFKAFKTELEKDLKILNELRSAIKIFTILQEAFDISSIALPLIQKILRLTIHDNATLNIVNGLISGTVNVGAALINEVIESLKRIENTKKDSANQIINSPDASNFIEDGSLLSIKRFINNSNIFYLDPNILALAQSEIGEPNPQTHVCRF